MDMFTFPLLFTLINVPFTLTEQTEHCQNEKFEAHCGSDEVVVMVTAVYGRMRVSHCVERDYGYIGCSRNVLQDADYLCSGKRTCQIAVPNPLFDATKPCPNDLKSYFRVEYTCTKVITVPDAICRPSVMIDISAPSGQLSSYVTDETDLGSAVCPWVIKGRRGQKINITLIDFSTKLQLDGACQAYAIVREKDPVRSFTICRGTVRVRHAYLSQGSTLEVRIVRPKNGKGRHFLLKYEVIGCGDPEVPFDGWLKRNGNEAQIGCKHSRATWRLTCEQNKWVGSYGNCTAGEAAGVFGDVMWGKHTIPFGSSMIIVVAIALTLGLLILITGLSILKCRKRPLPAANRFSDHQYQTTYKVPGSSVASRTCPVEQESLYQSPENEYAYISDLHPVNDIQAQNLSNRHMELYKARKCCDYGTAAGQQQQNSHPKQQQLPPAPQQQQAKTASKPRPLPPTADWSSAGKSRPEAQQRYVEKGNQRLADFPPTYFELDPADDKPEGGPRRDRRVKGPNCSVGAHGMEHDVMKRANQSTHDFTPTAYDHLVDTSGNNNHKSV